MPEPTRDTLIATPECHLCVDAEVVLGAVGYSLGLGWEARSITDDPALADEYWEKIPVVLVDGVSHDYWRIDAARLRAALAGPA
jgi:hypothetical protein